MDSTTPMYLASARLAAAAGAGKEKWFDEFEQRDKWKLW
jgi:hypothetical protein